MSEHEFDSYLALLSGMLGLSKAQREAISGELRDHMLERMHSLVAAGVPRDEAIAKALEEFGDASRLATGLAAAAAILRRRQIMRWTVGTLTTFGLLLFVALILWPSGKNGPVVQNAQAQDDVKTESVAPVAKETPKKVDDPNEVTFALLQEKIDLEFIETPLNEVVAVVREETGLQILLDSSAIEDLGIATDSPVTINLRGVSTILALELMLDHLGLGIAIREGVVIVTSRDEAEIQVLIRCYVVDDLVNVLPSSPASQSSTVMGRIEGLANQRRALLASGVQENIERGKALEASIISFADQLPFVRKNSADSVASLITTAIDVESWEERGGYGTIQLVGTTRVVKNSVRVHWKIENFLARLRRALKEQPVRPPPAPSPYITPQPTYYGPTPAPAPAVGPPIRPSLAPPVQPYPPPPIDGNPYPSAPPTPQPALVPLVPTGDDPFGGEARERAPSVLPADNPFAG